MRAIQLRIEDGRLTEDAFHSMQETSSPVVQMEDQGTLSEQDLRDLDRALDAGLMQVRSRTLSV